MNFYDEYFQINTLAPALQTGGALVTTQILGRLGIYSVSAQTTVVLGLVSGLVSILALKNFKLSPFVSIPVGVVVGLGAHRFFYPEVALTKIIGIKDFILLSAALLSVTAVLIYLQKRRYEEHESESRVATIGGVSSNQHESRESDSL